MIFRALKDLTCGTTACPSDIDACNSWNPTDIFVRTYDKKREFTKSFAFRICLLYTSPSPRDATLSRMPSSA